MNILGTDPYGTSVERMAYLRKEKEIVEMDFPLQTVWEEIIKAVTNLQWAIQETNEETRQVKAQTKANFMAYPSILTIQAIGVTDKTTRVTVSAETPVTTVTGIVDFGRTRERLDSFLLALVKQLKGERSTSEGKDPKSE
jgi:hypothetical protein